MRGVALMIVAMATLVLLSCGPKPPKAPGGDRLTWASEEPRPDWAYKEPFGSEGVQYFVGMSYKYADEKSSRGDAERDARLRAVRYLETAARETFERLVAELGMSAEVFNPSNAARGYVEMISQAVIQNTKIVHTYTEQWESAKTKEIYYISFGKLMLPDDQVMESFRDYSNRKRQEWNMTQEQFDRVNETFKDYWESKKAEQELKEKR